MSLTNGELVFLIAVALAVVVPIAISVRASTRWEPVTVPVTQWRRASHARGKRDPGYTWGVGIGIVVPYVVAVMLRLVDAPEGTGGLLFLGTILTCWAIHFFTRHRTNFFGAVPWGMVLGSLILPCVVGLLVLPILMTFGL